MSPASIKPIKPPDFGKLSPAEISELSQPSRKWSIKQNLEVYESNGNGSKFSLDFGDVVAVNRIYFPPNAGDSKWSEITRTSYIKIGEKWVPQTKTGWVLDFYLDDYNEDFPNNNDIVKIENPTQNPNNNAKQYMMWEKTEQNNMCGELCVAYIVKKEIEETSLESVLEKWKQAPNKGPFSYNLEKIKEGLIKEHLNDILQVYDVLKGQCQPIDSLLAEWNAALNAASVLEKLKDKLKTHYLIALVTIDGKGALIPKAEKIKHWVVVEEITRNGWGVKLYNPFSNKLQKYSLGEFASSCHKSGLWVKRKQPLKETDDVDDTFKVTLDLPKPADYDAEQYIDREIGKEKKKTQLCGEFCTAYILGKSVDAALEHWKQDPPSELGELTAILRAYGCYKPGNKSFTIGTVLDYWKMTQPQLYKHYIGANLPTGRHPLGSILKAYGYADGDLTAFTDGLRDTDAKTFLLSPGRMQKMLKTHFLIAGVAIDGMSGKLINRKKPHVPHWVVVEKIDPVGRFSFENSFGGNGGWVVLYNPFMNRREEYTYREFTNSMGVGGMDGLWVRRSVKPMFREQDVLQPPQASDPKKPPQTSFLTWAVNTVKEQSARIKDKTPADFLTELAVLFGLSRKKIAENLGNLLSDPIEKSLGVDSVSQEISDWISEKSQKDRSFAMELAFALRETGVLVIKENKGVLSENLMPLEADSTASDADPADKVANVIGNILAKKALEEIRQPTA